MIYPGMICALLNHLLVCEVKYITIAIENKQVKKQTYHHTGNTEPSSADKCFRIEIEGGLQFAELVVRTHGNVPGVGILAIQVIPHIVGRQANVHNIT